MADETLDNNEIMKHMMDKDAGKTDDFLSDDSLDIGGALQEAQDQAENQELAKKTAMKAKASKKRKATNKAKKDAGIRPPKQSKYPTRSHTFLTEATSDRAIHAVLNHKMTNIYKDGADIAPRILMGIPGFGKECKKNAFEHLVTLQNKIRESRGDNPTKAPQWIILSNDTSMIMDRNMLSRLEELKPSTVVAGAYGFEIVRASGVWYNPAQNEQEFLRGCYVQSNMENTEWDFIVGHEFKRYTKAKTVLIHGPFIAVRGEVFMTIDFSDMASNMKGGFFHYMAHISMECHKRNQIAAQIKTVSAQFEKIGDMADDEMFEYDQSLFTSTWQDQLPIIPQKLLGRNNNPR